LGSSLCNEKGTHCRTSKAKGGFKGALEKRRGKPVETDEGKGGKKKKKSVNRSFWVQWKRCSTKTELRGRCSLKQPAKKKHKGKKKEKVLKNQRVKNVIVIGRPEGDLKGCYQGWVGAKRWGQTGRKWAENDTKIPAQVGKGDGIRWEPPKKGARPSVGASRVAGLKKGKKRRGVINLPKDTGGGKEKMYQVL